ncbi:VWA domain-containing protein [Planctomicrobium sp. SH664]|uniref:VWA domain-containing protein n=1 Tax=Planctomicrobium sp. SH664 TaxID=3448125 RepID=UPI003F5B519B
MKLFAKVGQLVRRLVPPSRGAITLADMLPLLLFLFAYGVLIWRLSQPATYLRSQHWLMLGTGLALTGYWFTRYRGQLHDWRSWLRLALETACLAAVVYFDVVLTACAHAAAVVVGWVIGLLRLLLSQAGLLERLQRLKIWLTDFQLGGLTFTQPWRFLWMLTALWVWWMSLNGWSGLNRRRAAQALVVRLSLLGLFAMLLAEPRAVRTSDTLSVVYAVDMSASIHPDQVNEALKFVSRTVVDKPEKDEAGLVIFGSSAAVELPPEQSFPLDENSPEGTIYLNSRIDRDATNLEQALALGAAILPEETRGRIVLISDGSETAGNLKPVIAQLQSRGIAVDILPVTYHYENEVWLERMELPQTVKIGETYEASIVLNSLKAGKAKLQLTENGKPVADKPFDIEFKEGKNRIDIPIFLRGAGYYEYQAELIPEEGTDGRAENNRAVGYIYVEGEGKVLIVRDPFREDDRDFAQLARALSEGDLSVDFLDALDCPNDPLSYLPYDCIIFANVGQDAFVDPTVLAAIRDAVFNQGTGFLMVGGRNSFGPGGYHRTVVEEMLPVTMDITKKKILPKGALAIILHTCEFPEGNTWAKRITKQAIKVLGAQDEVGLIAYGPPEQWIFRLTPAGEYDRLVPQINAASIGDMPGFGATMQMAYEGLLNSDAATKHLIVISDGDPSPPPPALLNSYVKSMISISTVAIFPHGGQEVGLLRSIANATGGRYYFPADPNELPSIFIKEAKTLKRSMIQEQELRPEVGYPSVILEGIEAMPPLHGLVLTTLKENALTENVLFTVLNEKEMDEKDPVLAIWRYGLGTTAAFTSSLSNQWARDWVRWDQYRAFVKQLMSRVSRVRRAGQLRMWTYNSGGEGTITVEDFAPQEQFLDVVAQVSGPRNMQKSIPLKQVGPRRYQGTFPVTDEGRYQVTAIGKAGEREDRVLGGFVVAYSPEFLKFTSNWSNLRQIQQSTGGEELTAGSTAADIFNRRQPKQSSRPIFDWFLIALACLIPLDVAVRRVQIDWSVIRQKLGLGKKEDSGSTMGALLARKQQVSSTLKRADGPPLTPATGVPPPRTAPPAPTARTITPPSTPKPPASDGEEESMTSRLLRAKRKREEEK